MKEQYNSSQEKEKKLKKESQEKYEFLSEKQKFRREIEKSEKVSHLEELLEKGIISEQNVKNIEGFSQKEKQEIQKVLEKIDVLHKINFGSHFPRQLLVSKQDYLQALHDQEKKKKFLNQIDNTIGYVTHQINGGVGFTNIFSFFHSFFLDKKLVQLQEAYIDIQRSLVLK